MASYSHVWLSKFPVNGPHSNYPDHPPTSPQHSWPKPAPSLQGPDLSNCIKLPCLCLVCSPSQKSSPTFYLRKSYSFNKSYFSHGIFSDHSDYYGVIFSWNSDSLISVKNSLNFPFPPLGEGLPFPVPLLFSTEFSSLSVPIQTPLQETPCKCRCLTIQQAYSIAFLRDIGLLTSDCTFDLNQITIYLLRIYHAQGRVRACGRAKAVLDMTCPQGT